MQSKTISCDYGNAQFPLTIAKFASCVCARVTVPGGSVDCVALNHAPATFHRTVARSGTPQAMGNIAAFDTWGTIFPVCAHISLVGDGMALFRLHYCSLSHSLLTRPFFRCFAILLRSSIVCFRLCSMWERGVQTMQTRGEMHGEAQKELRHRVHYSYCISLLHPPFCFRFLSPWKRHSSTKAKNAIHISDETTYASESHSIEVVGEKCNVPSEYIGSKA